MKFGSTIVSATLILGLFTPAIFAQHDHGHVDILAYNDNGRVGTGFIDAESGSVETGVQLFAQDFDLVYPSLYGATTPGFFNNENYPLLPMSDLAFNALAMFHPDTQVACNLLYWDGQGAVNFASPTDGSTLQFRLSSSISISVDGSSDDVPGFVLETTGPDGVLHKHISYAARGAGGTQPADGFYLASIQLTMPGLNDSDPIYLLFNADYVRDAGNYILFEDGEPIVKRESEELAEAWIQQHLLGGLLPGDLNADGFVGLADLDIVLGHWNQSVPAGDRMRGDATDDGYVGLADLDVVLGYWNTGTPPTDHATLPEPSAVTCWLLTLAAGMRREKGRRS